MNTKVENREESDILWVEGDENDPASLIDALRETREKISKIGKII